MIFFIVSVPRQCVVPDVFVVGHLVGDGAAVVEGHAAVVGAISAVLRVRHGCASRGRRRTRLRTAPPLAPSDARCLWAYSNNTNRCTGRHSTLIPIFCWHQNKSSPAWWAATLATYCPHMPSQLSIWCQQNIGIKVLCRPVLYYISFWVLSSPMCSLVCSFGHLIVWKVLLNVSEFRVQEPVHAT